MPLQARRPNLPAISLPAKLRSQDSLSEDVHTPIPYTPIPFQQAPLVMTPDTPSFSLSGLDAAIAAKRGNSELEEKTDATWTEPEDGILQSYLMHPPRPLRTSYPPGSLPPASALDEITTQLLASTTSASISSSWKHSWKSTRSRLFTIARKESMSAVGGHKREKSESMSIVPISKPVRPKLTVLGSSNMKRQQHGMDSLYADDEPESFSETLRLSGTLQDTAAKDSDSSLTSGGGLSSPLAFTFNFNATTRKPGFPFPSSSFPLPPSLLQRCRSFTCEDFPDDDFALKETTPPKVRPEMQRSASSPVSALTTSPPSSISSQSISEELDLEFEPEEDPIIPLNQTFPHSLLGLRPREESITTGSSDGSDNMTPAGAPAITLTADSPTRATPRVMSGSTCVTAPAPVSTETDSPSPSLGFANLSLTTPFPLSSNPPTISTTGGLRRTLRPVGLSRSLSDTTTGSVRPLYQPVIEREAKRPKFRPGSGLSVAVPKAKMGGWEELKSPFEIKTSNA